MGGKGFFRCHKSYLVNLKYVDGYNRQEAVLENGDREVFYELTGKRSLTLDEDLAGLDEAFKMRLANLEGYIACQQTNRAFENPDSSWYFNRNSPRNEGKIQDRIQLFDTEYRDLAVSIMEHTSFVADTQKLFR